MLPRPGRLCAPLSAVARQTRAFSSAFVNAPSSLAADIPSVPHPYVDPSRTRMLPASPIPYAEMCSSFTMPTPSVYNMGADISDKHAHDKWDSPAIFYLPDPTDSSHHADSVSSTATQAFSCDKQFTMSFGQLILQSNRAANALVSRLHVQPGDRVALLLSQSPEAALLHAAIYKAGAVAVPLFVLFGPDAIEYRLRDSAATVIFAEPSKVDTVAALAAAGALPNLRAIVETPPLSAFNDPTPTQAAAVARGRQSYAAAAAGAVEVLHLSALLGPASSSFTPVATSPDTPALVVYTSGTTGPPKGALHGHRVLLGHIPGVEFPQSLFPQPGDRFWTPADWAWVGGLLDVLLPSLHHGVPVVAQRMRKFDAEEAWRTIGGAGVRNAFLPPTALKMMRGVGPEARRRAMAREGISAAGSVIATGEHQHTMRSVGSGGETLGEAVLQWGVEAFGLTINEFYGQTECNLVIGNCSVLPPSSKSSFSSGNHGGISPEVRPGSMGRAMPGHTLALIDQTTGMPLSDDQVAAGTVGTIAIKTPHPAAFLGYLNNPTATAEKFTKNAFLLTGDLARCDSDGYYWYVGRDDDVIKTAGYRVGPSEVESCLLRHGAVANAAVVGVPDEVRGEAIKAFVVLTPEARAAAAAAAAAATGAGAGATAGSVAPQDDDEDDGFDFPELRHDLVQFVRARLAQHQYPRHIQFVDALPMTTTGKVVRRELRERERKKYRRVSEVAAGNGPPI